jgi:hypothetical protein
LTIGSEWPPPVNSTSTGVRRSRPSGFWRAHSIANSKVSLNFTADELRELVDERRLKRAHQRQDFDADRFAEFHWLVVEEAVTLDREPEARAVPVLFMNLNKDLGEIEPHKGRFPLAFEAALFFLLLERLGKPGRPWWRSIGGAFACRGSIRPTATSSCARTRCRRSILKDSMPPRDAFQVRKLREVGALVLAKSNMAEFAVSPYETVGSLLPGYTRNPYALDRVPAGSSGGTAVAVAASFGAAGLGTDTGNSIRGPSSHTSLVGIRSTMGLTSRDGIVPRQLHRDIGGPIARTVADAAAIFDVIAGSDPADPVTSSPAILAAKGATTTIPIVFGFGADPIETGLVSSLDHPGGNITGVTSTTVGIGSKRLGLLLDLVPRATGVAVLVDPNDDATVVRSMIADVRGAAIPVGRGIEVFYARDVDDIDAAFTGLAEKRSEVLFVSPSSFFSSHRMESRRTDELWAQHLGAVSPTRRLCRPHSRRPKARRSTGEEGDKTRVRHQPQDRQGARPHHPRNAARHRRRGDSMSREVRIGSSSPVTTVAWHGLSASDSCRVWNRTGGLQWVISMYPV